MSLLFRNRPPISQAFTWPVLVMLLSGCAGDMNDLRQYVEETKSKYQGSVEPLPQFQPYKNHVYSVFDYRAPFDPPVAAQEQEVANNNGAAPDIQRRKETLEFFPLDSLQMVGTLEQQGQVWGLVKDPEGTIHRIQRGNYMGQNFGEVIRIEEDSIDLLEIIPDGLGAWVEREISLTLGEQT
ncbi:MAG TPA: pilus assembly protein PilP [Gammaproteobacteria bacterium]